MKKEKKVKVEINESLYKKVKELGLESYSFNFNLWALISSFLILDKKEREIRTIILSVGSDLKEYNPIEPPKD